MLNLVDRLHFTAQIDLEIRQGAVYKSCIKNIDYKQGGVGGVKNKSQNKN